MRKFMAVCALIALLGLAVSWAADVQTSVPVSGEQKRAAVRLVRAVLNAEIAHRAANGKFATLDQLAQTGHKIEPLPGFKLRLVVAPQGDAFQLAIIGDTGWSLFSDEQALIYQGEPLK